MGKVRVRVEAGSHNATAVDKASPLVEAALGMTDCSIGHTVCPVCQGVDRQGETEALHALHWRTDRRFVV